METLILIKAFFVIRSICFCQLSSFEISKSRCLCSVTWLIIVLFIIRGGWKGLLIFLVIVIVSVFWGLKFTSHLVDHAWIVAMSLFNVIADSRGLSTITYKLVSSANSFIDEWISVTISLLDNLKRYTYRPCNFAILNFEENMTGIEETN
jgi:hypothetical protein